MEQASLSGRRAVPDADAVAIVKSVREPERPWGTYLNPTTACLLLQWSPQWRRWWVWPLLSCSYSSITKSSILEWSSPRPWWSGRGWWWSREVRVRLWWCSGRNQLLCSMPGIARSLLVSKIEILKIGVTGLRSYLPKRARKRIGYYFFCLSFFFF